MARTVVGYIGANGMNNMASTVATGSVETTTGLPINTGLGVGQFRELTAGEAKLYSYKSGSTFPWGQLYDGTYMWVQLDPTVSTDPIPLGTAVAWLGSAEDGASATQVTTLNTTSNADVAGWTIDSNFGKTHPYAFIQLNGKVNALFDATAASAYADVISPQHWHPRRSHQVWRLKQRHQRPDCRHLPRGHRHRIRPQPDPRNPRSIEVLSHER